MKSRTLIVVLAALIAISGLSYAGWRFVHERESQDCAACLRPLHGHANVKAVVGGKQVVFCCPACALSQHRQTGKPVRILSVTDYETGATLDPDKAYLVRGSDVSSCAHRAAAVDVTKHPMEAQFDRCSPSLLAFSSREAAERFERGHGGRVMRVSEAAAAAAN